MNSFFIISYNVGGMEVSWQGAATIQLRYCIRSSRWTERRQKVSLSKVSCSHRAGMAAKRKDKAMANHTRSTGCSGYREFTRLNRRNFLKAGVLSPFGLSL